MLIIDENLFKLAKMQETLLKVSTVNRIENLNNYKKTTTEIDSKAFADIKEKIQHLNEYNHSLEEELEFLEKIKSTYEQLLELQSSFKRVCETYGDKTLKLSDLSQLNIEYIENRISAINGYLTNIKNIETNKSQLQELSEQLVTEEKKKNILEDRLIKLEESLKYSFITAEGRCVVIEQTNSKNQSTTIKSEYEQLNLDFEELLTDNITIDELLTKTKIVTNENELTLKATKICFELTPTPENRKILEDNNKNLIQSKYRLIMLEIIKLLSQNYIDYDSCKNKREQLLKLIEDRKKCLKLLDIHLSIDPFDRTKANEQLETIKSMTDNSKIINNIRKRISDLTTRIEEMSNQNTNYLITLNDTKNLIESKTSLNDIDITSIELPITEVKIKKEITKNQVIKIRNISSKLNMNIIKQKTTSVIKRVYQMLNRKTQIIQEPTKEINPELVVIPSIQEDKQKEPIFDNPIFEAESSKIPSFNIETSDIDENEELEESEVIEEHDEEETQAVSLPYSELNSLDIFETVNPFEEPVLFTEKADEDVIEVKTENESLPTIELDETEEKTNNEFELSFVPTNETTTDSFWPTQEAPTIDKKEPEKQELSFDEQIQMLILPEEDNAKTRKKVA